MAYSSKGGARSWCAHAGILFRAVVLRWVSYGSCCRKPASSPAGLLRRTHLRAHRSAPWPVLPHQLDRKRRTHRVVNLQRVKQSTSTSRIIVPAVRISPSAPLGTRHRYPRLQDGVPRLSTTEGPFRTAHRARCPFTAFSFRKAGS